MTDRNATMTKATQRLAEDVKDAASSEIADLRAKVEELMADRVSPAIAAVAGQAEQLAHGAAASARRQSDQLASTVRAQPFAAIGTAALAGIAIGLMMRR